MPRTAAILVPGSGTSRLSEDMLADGYTGGITNIDISRTAIDLMADRCKDRAGLQCAWRPRGDAWQSQGARALTRTHNTRAHTYTLAFSALRLPRRAVQVMNSCSLGFPDASFDAVIDKAMLDSLLCGEASTANTGRYVGEVARVLKPGGTFIIVSFGAPENRLSYLEGDYGWQVTVHSIPKPTVNTAGLPEVNSSDPSQQHVRSGPRERGQPLPTRAHLTFLDALYLTPHATTHLQYVYTAKKQA